MGLLVIAGVLLGAPAFAEVQLTTSVDKVVHVTTADGELETMLLDASGVRPGEVLRYTIEFVNASSEFIDPGIVIVTNPIPEAAEYLEGTAIGADTEILYSVDNGAGFARPEALRIVDAGVELLAAPGHYTTIRWIYGGILGPGEGSSVSFDVRLREDSPGSEVPADAAN